MKRYRVDFFLPYDIVVECDGRYWHSRPWVSEKDKLRDANLESNGFIVKRFKEADIKKNVDSCVKSLVDEFPFLVRRKIGCKDGRPPCDQQMAIWKIFKHYSSWMVWPYRAIRPLLNISTAWICSEGCLPHRGQSRLPQI